MVSPMSAGRVDASTQIRELENMELSGRLEAEHYGRLMALYLMSGRICEAKLLWTRLPAELKANDDLQAKLRLVWKCLWDRDYPGAYAAVDSQEWPAEINGYMRGLVVRLRGQLLDLFSKAYTSVKLDRMSLLLGIPEPAVMEICAKMDWRYEPESGLVYPKPVSSSRQLPSASESQLHQFTATVSFLEK